MSSHWARTVHSSAAHMGSGHVPGFAVDTVDATGCGDAFAAGLLCQLIQLENWREQLSPSTLSQVLRYANSVGALNSLNRGVIPALPYRTDVDRFLKDNSGPGSRS